MTQEDDTTLVVNGSLRTIEYAVTASGAMPAKEFIKELDDGEKRKLDVLFRRMAEMGRIFNREQFKQVEGKIYEFKRFQLRIGCFQAEHRWVLTHGFFKKSDKWPKSEIDRAQRIMNEHLQRKTGGSKPERPKR